MYKGIENFNTNKILILSGIGILAILFMVVTFHLNKRVITSSLVAGLVFSWLLLLCICNRQKKVLNRITLINNIGRHSFGIYCLHILCVNTVIYFKDGLCIKSNMLTWVICLIAVFVASYIIGSLAEKYVKINRI